MMTNRSSAVVRLLILGYVQIIPRIYAVVKSQFAHIAYYVDTRSYTHGYDDTALLNASFKEGGTTLTDMVR